MNTWLNNFFIRIKENLVRFQEWLGLVFDRFIDFLPTRMQLSSEKKQEVWSAIEQDSRYTKIYWLQMFLASFIAALGLLQNSTAVVIGAMLVAPLLRPMQGVAYSIATAQSKNILHNLKVLLLSTLLAIGTGFLVSVISPVDIETAEVLARVSPNFLDLLIAVASAAIAFLALSFRSLSVSIAGVAMAASLVPPLVASGITLALGVINHAWGAFFLYITNLVAILIIGVIIFFLFGYRPHQEEDTKNTATRFGLLILLVIGISIPLIITLSNLSKEIRFTQLAQQSFYELTEEHMPEADVTQFQARRNKNGGNISATLALPEEISFYIEDQEQISDQLADILDTDITMNFTLLRTASVQSLDQDTLRSVEQRIKQSIRSQLVIGIPDVSIISIDTTRIESESNAQIILARTVLALGSDTKLLSDIELLVQESFVEESISFAWVPIELIVESQDTSAQDLHQEFVKSEVSRVSHNLLSEGEHIKNIKVTIQEIVSEDLDDEVALSEEEFTIENIDYYTISFDLYSIRSKQGVMKDLKDELQVGLGKEVRLVIQVIPTSVIAL